jgi:hypothetical protein
MQNDLDTICLRARALGDDSNVSALARCRWALAVARTTAERAISASRERAHVAAHVRALLYRPHAKQWVIPRAASVKSVGANSAPERSTSALI